MLARVVLFSLVLEAAFYAALAAWLHQRWEWSAGAIAALVAGLLFGSRLLLSCFTCFLGWRHGSPRAPEHRIDAWGTVRLVLGEYRALLLDNLYYLPWDRLAVRPDEAPSPSATTPTLLVHGYMSNRGYFAALVPRLEAAGIGPLHVPNFRVLFTPIEFFAAELHDAIERVAQATGRPKVNLVCHSMGGLAARQYLREHGPARIAKLVTIASPHHGTMLASLGLGLNARQMHPQSEFLRALEAFEAIEPPAVDATSIYSTHDNLVSPQETSRLPWARNVAIPGVGHVAILRDARAFEVVRAELAG